MIRIDRIGPSKDVHVLLPGTCKCVTLHRKRDFADIIKDFETRRFCWIFQVNPL